MDIKIDLTNIQINPAELHQYSEKLQETIPTIKGIKHSTDAKELVVNGDGTEDSASILTILSTFTPADNSYQVKRQKEYPKIGDQFDMLFKAIKADPTLRTQFADFYNAIDTVKEKHKK